MSNGARRGRSRCAYDRDRHPASFSLWPLIQPFSELLQRDEGTSIWPRRQSSTVRRNVSETRHLKWAILRAFRWAAARAILLVIDVFFVLTSGTSEGYALLQADADRANSPSA